MEEIVKFYDIHYFLIFFFLNKENKTVLIQEYVVLPCFFLVDGDYGQNIKSGFIKCGLFNAIK